jgi:hypothetical protein
MFLTVSSPTALKAVAEDKTEFEVTDQLSALRALRYEARICGWEVASVMCSSSIDFPDENGMDEDLCARLVDDFKAAMKFNRELHRGEV